MKSRKSYNAFTLIEILLVVALITTISIISIPSILLLLENNQLNSASKIIRQSIRTAQTNSRESKNNSSWGVKINTSNIVIFQGTSYSARVTTNDITNNYQTVWISGDTEIVFENKTGTLTTTKSVVISKNSKTITLSINEKGRINY